MPATNSPETAQPAHPITLAAPPDAGPGSTGPAVHHVPDVVAIAAALAQFEASTDGRLDRLAAQTPQLQRRELAQLLHAVETACTQLVGIVTHINGHDELLSRNEAALDDARILLQSAGLTLAAISEAVTPTTSRGGRP